MKLRSGRKIVVKKSIVKDRVVKDRVVKEDYVSKCIRLHLPYLREKLNVSESLTNIVEKMKVVTEIYEYIYNYLNDFHEAKKISQKWENFYNTIKRKVLELILQACDQIPLVKSDTDSLIVCINCISTLTKVQVLL